MHGTVSVTGTGFEQQLVLRSAAGPLRLVAGPADSAALVRVAGLGLSVRGTDVPRGLAVASFTVVSANGQTALDGILRRSSSGLVLQTAKGAVPLGNPPDTLRQMAGARVWITGSPATGPNSYGVIVPR